MYMLTTQAIMDECAPARIFPRSPKKLGSTLNFWELTYATAMPVRAWVNEVWSQSMPTFKVKS